MYESAILAAYRLPILNSCRGVFDAWGIGVIFPLYSLHALVLGGWLFRLGVNWQRLFLFGCVFGMYEAYITKVLWNPYWGPDAFQFLGIYWFQFAVLVFFWHPIFAFILPLLIAEYIYTSSNTLLNAAKQFPLMQKAGKKFALLLAALAGLNQSVNTPPSMFWVALLSFFTILTPSFLLEKRKIEDIMPSGRVLKLLTFALIILYLFWTFALRFDKMGSFSGQLVVWLFYLLLFYLIINIKSCKPESKTSEKKGERRFFAACFLVYLTAFLITSSFKAFPAAMLFLLAGTAYGTIVFASILIKFLMR